MQNVVQLFTEENPTALVDRVGFTDRISLLAKICGRQVSPILGHIRVSSETGGLALLATNSGLQAETSFPADVDARFSAALPAASLVKLLRKAPPNETVLLSLLAEGGGEGDDRFRAAKCSIEVGATQFIVDAMTTDEFPDPIRHAEEVPVQRFSIASGVLWNALDGTRDAMSTEETRYYLNGVFLHNHNGRLRFTATDGHRLYIQDTNVQTKAEVAAILPTKGVEFVAELLDGYASAEPVQVELSDGIAVFVFRGVAVTMKTVDGAFPDYQRVVPAEPDKTAIVAGAALATAVAALTDGTDGKVVRLSFGAGAIAIQVDGAAGAGSTTIECTYEGDNLDVAFGAKNLKSAIEAASPDGRNMTIRMRDAMSPALITGSIGGWTGVLMPSA